MTASARSRIRSLDGLRGLAVLAVVLFHLGATWLPGGLLGVDVFFVLSGFLITGLLLGEWQRTGRISLRVFWVRRWRRLLPALLLTLGATTLLAQWLSDPAEVPGIRHDALATMLYAANWHAVAAGQSYFDIIAPSPLRHTWSLAVEEQFYVVWPLLAILALARMRSVRVFLALAVGGGLLSAALMAALAADGSSTDRLYYGTDTRAQALLVGAALAVLLQRRGLRLPGVDPPAPPRRALRGMQLVGVGSVVALLIIVLRTDGQSRWLYRGGFLLVALLTAAVVAAVVAVPEGSLARAVAFRPLAYLGRISYGVYLWHWPIVIFATPGRVGLSGPALAGVRAALTLIVSAASFALIEQPIRRHGLRLPWPTGRRVAWSRVLVPGLVAGLALAFVVAPDPRGSTTLAAFQGSAAPAPPPAAPPDVAASPQPSAGSDGQRLLASAVSRSRPVRIMIVGDSVAFSLGRGIQPAVDPSSVSFTNQGYWGCGVARGNPRGWQQPPACLTWPQRWQSLVDRFRPDVTLLLPSIWDTLDRPRDGHWSHVGDPATDGYLRGEYVLALQVLTSRGGRVGVLEPPCNDEGRANSTGQMKVPPEHEQKMTALTGLLEDAARSYPGRTATVDLADLICPDGVFQPTRDGRPLRTDDGIHMQPYAGELFVRVLLPPLLRWLRTPVYAPASPVRIG